MSPFRTLPLRITGPLTSKHKAMISVLANVIDTLKIKKIIKRRLFSYFSYKSIKMLLKLSFYMH